MFLEALIAATVSVFILVTFFFFLSLITQKTSVADVAWGIGFIVISAVTLWQTSILSPRQILLFFLVLLWGVRLSTHIYLRNQKKQEDFRYSNWKEKWGRGWIIKSYLYVFLLQGLLMILISLPVIYTNVFGSGSIGLLDRLGIIVWLVGFYFEAVGDWQLLQFKRQFPSKKGRVLTTGLWKYTRHPNYFGESTMWWGIYIIALSNLDAWWTIIGPIFITFSLLKVSGVALLEKRYKGNKEYKKYQERTSMFLPWWPKD